MNLPKLTIKAIETRYRGYRFRSRLEARWAVFFDALGIEWQYEPEGFHVEASGTRGWNWLPDFFLPKCGTWIEVKGDWTTVDADYFHMLACACDWGGYLPGISSSYGSSRGLLLLGTPDERDSGRGFPVIQHHKGLWIGRLFFVSGGAMVMEYMTGYMDSSWGSGSEYKDIITPHLNYDLYYPGMEGTYGSDFFRALSAFRSARFEHGEAPCL